MAVGLKLFEHICSAPGPISSAELSKLSGGEEMLICKLTQYNLVNVLIFKARILRVVASVEFVEQSGPNDWLANETTRVVALPTIAAGYRCVYSFGPRNSLRPPVD